MRMTELILYVSCLITFVSSCSADEPAATTGKDRFVWFVFVGGSAETPVWTVRKSGRVDSDLPAIYSHQLGAQLAIIEAQLGVAQIVCSADCQAETTNLMTQSIQRVVVQRDDIETLCINLINGLRPIRKIPAKAALELQCPVKSIVRNDYATGYSDEPAVLGVTDERRDGLLRLCKLTTRLLRIAAEVSGAVRTEGDKHEAERQYSLEEMERLWKDSILGRHGLTADSVMIWKSFGVVEICFDKDVPLNEWMPAIAGRYLSN
jgi:hypothetical protein